MANESATNPLDELIDRIRQTLGELAPESLLNRLKPVFEDFLGQFQLVPQREFQAHLEHLQQLEASVSQLDMRIRSLESRKPSQNS
jgi:polyhydroxyalkanoate synthesis regulator phasin